MSKRESKWITLFGFLVVILTTIPYLLGFMNQGENWVFTGFVYGVEDGNSYIAKMLQGSSGFWLFRSPYSSMPQRGVLAFLPFILLGKLVSGKELHLQLVVLFHLLRIGGIFFVISATYRFISLFVKSFYWRRWVTAVVTVGGGVGWLLVFIGQSNWLDSLPLEWYSPEWFGFLSCYGLPHMLLARGLLLTGLTFYLSAPGNTQRAWYAGFIFLALGFVHPLSLVSAIAIIGAHQVATWLFAWRRKNWKQSWVGFKIAFRALMIPAPIVLYTVIQFSTDPFLKAWTEQNRILTPHPLHIVVAYGLMLVPAALGVRDLLRKRRWSGKLLLAWIVILPLLAYAPHNLQRRFPEGIWVAIVTVASIGIIHYSKGDVRREKQYGRAIFLLAIPTAVMLIYGGMQVALKTTQPVFRSREEVETFVWLRKHSDPGIVVLSTYQTGNALPAWIPGFVVIGHGPESANLVEFRVKVSEYYDGQLSIPDQMRFIEDQGIDYVFFGPEEDDEGDLKIGELNYLNLVYQSGAYQIYKVANSEVTSP